VLSVLLQITAEEGQTTQWPKDTKVVIRSCKPKKDRQHNDQNIPKWWSEAVNRRRTDNTIVILRFTASDYNLGIFWSLCCLSFFGLQLLITTWVSFGHCVVCPSSVYSFWLPLWYLLVIVLSVLLRFTASDYHLGIFWSLCCLSFFGLRLLITTWVYFGHCVVCPSSVYSFWLQLGYLQTFLFKIIYLLDSIYLNKTMHNVVWSWNCCPIYWNNIFFRVKGA
jgi:hypothetical protein